MQPIEFRAGGYGFAEALMLYFFASEPWVGAACVPECCVLSEVV